MIRPSTPRPSPRQIEEQRLRIETNGLFAPAKKDTFHEQRRERLVENHVQQGLEAFDQAQRYEP